MWYQHPSALKLFEQKVHYSMTIRRVFFSHLSIVYCLGHIEQILCERIKKVQLQFIQADNLEIKLAKSRNIMH